MTVTLYRIYVRLPWRSFSSRSIPGTDLDAFSRNPPRLPWFLKGGLPLQCTAYTRQPSEYMSDAVTSCSSSAYSGALKLLDTSLQKILDSYPYSRMTVGCTAALFHQKLEIPNSKECHLLFEGGWSVQAQRSSSRPVFDVFS
jgi:hypothetical protein